MTPIRHTSSSRRSSTLTLAIVFLVSLLGSAERVTATTYYVAPPPTGNDSNSGTSIGAPWATLQFAAGEVGPGDVVRVRAGTFAGFELTTSGSSGSPITFSAYSGEEPMIAADGPAAGVGINLEAASHIVIEGFRVHQRSSYGIRAVVGSNVVLRNNRLTQSGQSGILVAYLDDALVEGNIIDGPGIAAGILALDESSDLTVRRNWVTDHDGGINLVGDSSIGGTGLFVGALIENNIVDLTGRSVGSGLSLWGVQNALVRNNLLFGLPRYGITLGTGLAGGASTGNRLLNNTVVVLAGGQWALYTGEAATGTVLHNNILLNDSTRGSIAMESDSLPGLDSDRNLVVDRFSTNGGSTIIDLEAWRTATGMDESSALGTPGATFLAPGAGDYHLHEASPAVDAGLTLIDVPTDLEGFARPYGPAFDLGAFEWSNVIFNDGFEVFGGARWSVSVGL